MKKTSIISLLVGVILSSCFEEDERVLPYLWNGETFESPVSVYTNQIYVDLASGNAVIHPSDAWDLAFESAPDGWHIRINTGNYLGVSPTGTCDMALTMYPSENLHFTYDKSDGDPDSTAVGNWTEQQDESCAGPVYLIGKFDGLSYKPSIKIQFRQWTDSSLTFWYAPPSEAENFTKLTLAKDSSCMYTYYSFTGGLVKVEPPRYTWDLLISQYTTTLYTDDGVPTPYFVRGVLLNPWETLGALDSSMEFEGINLSDTSGIVFSKGQDLIGHDWKDVKVNTQTGTAQYFVRPRHTYFIHNNRGVIYKIRFISYYSPSFEPGFPAFDYQRLN